MFVINGIIFLCELVCFTWLLLFFILVFLLNTINLRIWHGVRVKLNVNSRDTLIAVPFQAFSRHCGAIKNEDDIILQYLCGTH